MDKYVIAPKRSFRCSPRWVAFGSISEMSAMLPISSSEAGLQQQLTTLVWVIRAHSDAWHHSALAFTFWQFTCCIAVTWILSVPEHWLRCLCLQPHLAPSALLGWQHPSMPVACILYAAIPCKSGAAVCKPQHVSGSHAQA